MVDFGKLRAAKKQSPILDPSEIFRRLPKPSGINDLYTSQAQVLESWHKRRNENDLVIKLPTGGGKTLVGLLIAQSILNETSEPVLYLAPTRQLVQQTLTKAHEYSIPAVAYQNGERDFPEEFLAGKSVLICTYQALFNGLSRFGVRGSANIVHVAGIILDDSHVAFSSVRDSFTLEVEKSKHPNDYEFLTNVFRNDFKELGRLGTFDDVVGGIDYSTVLEVPYWSWYAKSDQVQEYLRSKSDSYKFEWPFLRDTLNYCHCLVSKKSFVTTPVFPLVDLIPTFANCQRRIFMSATIGDDSAIIRTFGAAYESTAKPIVSNSLAGVSERMILAPEMMRFPTSDIPRMLHTIAQSVVKSINAGVVILVPSAVAAKPWEEVATFADSTESVAESVKELQDGTSYGPFVFANRYDGIDLPNQSCRLLILSDLPGGASEYDRYRASTFMGGNVLNTSLAQRIEQGMGRGARGTSDFCVVIITGRKLIAWISRSGNTKFLTSSTRAQLEMGINISKDITDRKSLGTTMKQCFQRDKEWTEYHAETLAELDKPDQIDINGLQLAEAERKAFSLWRDGYFDKAIAKLQKYIQEGMEIDQQSKGWLSQFIARIAYYHEKKDIAQEFQQQAYAQNRDLMRPQVLPPYITLLKPGKQAEAIVARITSFRFRRGYIADFDEEVSHLVPEASSNQFEQALAELGSMLGFSTERPDNVYGKGPDVLWLLNDNLGLVIEAKSRKNHDNALTKEQHGQLLNAFEWFKEKYPTYTGIRVSLHPNVLATKSTVTGETKALTFDKLRELITDARKLLEELCESTLQGDELVIRCEQLLITSPLNSRSLVTHYLLPFEWAEE